MKRRGDFTYTMREQQRLVRQLTASLEQIAREGRTETSPPAARPLVTFLDPRGTAPEIPLPLPDNIIQFPVPGK